MGLTKTESFTDSQNELALFAKALGHPARVAILEFLLKTDKCICGDIVNELPLSQPTVSQHLRALKEADLIRGNIEGTAICYCINPEPFKKFMAVVGAFIKEYSNNPTKCC
jgi:ArsR family transcriptional regulator, arsenate/arsenite/antimonite-responsive transcriptional repressor